MADSDKLTNEEAASHMQLYISYHANVMPESNFDNAFSRAVEVRSAQISSPGVTAKAVFAWKIPKNYSNSSSEPRTTHGGAIATFFDWTTSMVVVACNMPGWETTGLTRRLDVTYFKPVVEVDDLLRRSARDGH